MLVLSLPHMIWLCLKSYVTGEGFAERKHEYHPIGNRIGSLLGIVPLYLLCNYFWGGNEYNPECLGDGIFTWFLFSPVFYWIFCLLRWLWRIVRTNFEVISLYIFIVAVISLVCVCFVSFPEGDVLESGNTSLPEKPKLTPEMVLKYLDDSPESEETLVDESLNPSEVKSLKQLASEYIKEQNSKNDYRN